MWVSGVGMSSIFRFGTHSSKLALHYRYIDIEKYQCTKMLFFSMCPRLSPIGKRQIPH
jgi:hypothetical protein